MELRGLFPSQAGWLASLAMRWLMVGMVGGAPGALAESYRMYRCQVPGGGVEFRQHPCPEGQGMELRIEDRPVGWEAPPEIPDSDWKPSPAPTPKSDGASAARRGAQEEKCWKVSKRLERVNARLRQGYRPAEGMELRRDQAEYTDYLNRFCQ